MFGAAVPWKPISRESLLTSGNQCPKIDHVADMCHTKDLLGNPATLTPATCMYKGKVGINKTFVPKDDELKIAKDALETKISATATVQHDIVEREGTSTN